jgi:MFS family permease
LWRALRDPGLLYAALVGFMHHFLFYLFAAFFPLYALAAGINLTQIGFLRGAFALINAAVRGLSGLVLERVGRRHAVTIGLLCHLAALVAIPYFQSFVPLLIVIGFLGFWRAVVLVANTIGLAEDPDPGRVPRGIASGVYHAAADLAGLTAGVAGGAVAVAAGLDNLFRVLPTVAIAVYLVFAVGLERAARSASLARAATEPRHS